MGDLRYSYQTLRVQNRSISAGGSSGGGLAAGVELLQKLSIALNGMAVSWRVNRELQSMNPRLESERQAFARQIGVPVPRVGVLVVVGLMEWRHSDPDGNRAQSFLSIHSAGAGTDAATVLRQYLSTSRLLQAPPDGWSRRDEYVWVTITD